MGYNAPNNIRRQMENTKPINPKKEKDATKLTTSKLAVQLGMKTNELNKKLVLLGYLEKKNKDFHLTQEGKKAGGTAKSTGASGCLFFYRTCFGSNAGIDACASAITLPPSPLSISA